LSSNGRPILIDGKVKGIQLQNLPNQFKDCIGPHIPGNVFGEADGSQLEFRVAAFLGQDQAAINNIRTDVDQHCLSASVMMGIQYETFVARYGDKLTFKEYKEYRRLAKPDTFKPLYGGTRGTPEQEKYYKWFQQEYHQLYETQTEWTMQVLTGGRLRMPWGMEFHWPYTKRDDRTGYIDNTPSIFNYPVQSLATADIIPIALVYMWHRAHVNDKAIILNNTVHDSVTGEFPPESADTFRALAVQCFTEDVYRYLEEVYNMDFNVPLGVGMGVGSGWNTEDMDEIELNVERDGEYWEKGARVL
jgi:hypothetical protein